MPPIDTRPHHHVPVTPRDRRASRAKIGSIVGLLHDDGRAQSCVLVDRATARVLSGLWGVDAVVHMEHPLGRAIHDAWVGERRMYLAGGRIHSVQLTSIDECV